MLASARLPKSTWRKRSRQRHGPIGRCTDEQRQAAISEACAKFGARTPDSVTVPRIEQVRETLGPTACTMAPDDSERHDQTQG
jgi:hypothetical protein